MKKSEKIVSIILSVCFVVIGISGLLFHIPKLLKKKDMFANDISITTSMSDYDEFSDPYNPNNFHFSSALAYATQKVETGTMLSINSQLFEGDGVVKIQSTEGMNTEGGLVDSVYLDNSMVGEVAYNSLGLVDEINLNGNIVVYDYSDNGELEKFYANEDRYSYEYENNRISAIYQNEELYVKYEYNQDGKLIREIYPVQGLWYEHTNSATIEYQYNPKTQTKIISKITDYLNQDVYQLSYKTVQGQRLISKVVYGNKEIEFDYGYFYNNKAYITSATEQNKTTYFHYVNDKLLAKYENGTKFTYIYTSEFMPVAVHVSNDIGQTVVNLITDPLGNVIEANYQDYVGPDQVAVTQKIFERRYNAYGVKTLNNLYCDEVDIGLGFMGGLSFDEFGLVFCEGNLYSSLIGGYIQGEDTFNERIIKVANTKRGNPTFATVEKNVAIEALQNAIALEDGSSSFSNVPLVYKSECVGKADIYTSPVVIDGDNMLKNPSRVYMLANSANDVDIQNASAIAQLYDDEEFTPFAMLDSYYPSKLSQKSPGVQYVYRGKLYTLGEKVGGVYTYDVSENNRKFYTSDVIVDYDSGRYIRYKNVAQEIENYVEALSFLVNFSSAQELDDYFNAAGVIDTSVGQTFADVDFGENDAFMKRLIYNTQRKNIPEYDVNTQYLDIDENGDFIVCDIPEGAGPEYVRDMSRIIKGVFGIISGVVMLASGIAVVVGSFGTAGGLCAVAIFKGALGVVAGICGIIQAVNGVSQVVDGATGSSWLLENIYHGDRKLLDTVADVAAIVGTVCLITASFIKTSCFVAGTQVATDVGPKNIEDVRVGDNVLSYNEQTGQREYKRVQEVYVNQSDDLCVVTAGGKQTTCTTTHPYFVDGEYVPASNLRPGDVLLQSDGSSTVVENIKLIDSKQTKVYNLNVEDNHNYFANGVLVHNTCAPNAPKGDKLSNYTVKELEEPVEQANVIVDREFKLAGKNTRWPSVRKEIWKEAAKRINTSNRDISKLILNFKDVLEKGKAPIIRVANSSGGFSTCKVQLHHVVSKSNDMFRVVPMTPEKHTMFHRIYGYKFWAPKIPWIKK